MSGVYADGSRGDETEMNQPRYPAGLDLTEFAARSQCHCEFAESWLSVVFLSHTWQESNGKKELGFLGRSYVTYLCSTWHITMQCTDIAKTAMGVTSSPVMWEKERADDVARRPLRTVSCAVG